MSKAQLDLRISRVVYAQFVELCRKEKLRPGEAVESLIQASLEAGSLTNFTATMRRGTAWSRRVDELFFESSLRRLRASLEGDRKLLKARGDRGVLSHTESLLAELRSMAPAIADQALQEEFEKLVEEADRVHGEELKSQVDQEIQEQEEG